MTKEQKRAFIAEIKVEMRDMINAIAVHYVTEESRTVNKRIDILEKNQNHETKEMIDKFDREILIVSEYCKKQV